MKLIARLFSRQWLFATLLAAAGCAAMARLGIWQLDRLAQRREFNARALAWVDAPPLELEAESLENDLFNMEYRPAVVTGDYVFEEQVALKNRQFGPQLGVVLLTPLRIAGTDMAVLVARGWIPQEDANPDAWSTYDQIGEVIVRGVLRRSESEGDFGGLVDPTPSPGQGRLDLWNSVNVARIAGQAGLPLLTDVYVQLIPDAETAVSLPYPLPLELEISEGPHAGYAAQWFIFAVILAIGYPFYVLRQERWEHREAVEEPADLPEG
ncbi:MAG: SURF1 family protein [Chloroflexi bacterium]|nr:SURF1 family protein [Chloroflexota bacterium]